MKDDVKEMDRIVEDNIGTGDIYWNVEL
jgi:hypothetical protein